MKSGDKEQDIKISRKQGTHASTRLPHVRNFVQPGRYRYRERTRFSVDYGLFKDRRAIVTRARRVKVIRRRGTASFVVLPSLSLSVYIAATGHVHARHCNSPSTPLTRGDVLEHFGRGDNCRPAVCVRHICSHVAQVCATRSRPRVRAPRVKPLSRPFPSSKFEYRDVLPSPFDLSIVTRPPFRGPPPIRFLGIGSILRISILRSFYQFIFKHAP